MRCKVISYPLKNGSAPGTKARKLKSTNTKFDSRQSGNGVKDHRKYQNDKILSEAEKMARRMDLESMKNKLQNFGGVKGEQMFKPLKVEKEWETDPMLLKVKALGRLDEGLNNSSSDSEEDTKDDSGKYFADGLTSTKYNKKKTLEDTIRESKLKKIEKQTANELDNKMMKNLDNDFNKTYRHILPKIGQQIKLQMKGNNKESLKDEFGCDEAFEMLSMAEKPKRVELVPLGIENNEKKNEKLISNKLDRLKEHLKRAGINSDDETAELYPSDLDSEESNDEENVSDNDNNNCDESSCEDDSLDEEDNNNDTESEDNNDVDRESEDNNDVDGESEDNNDVDGESENNNVVDKENEDDESSSEVQVKESSNLPLTITELKNSINESKSNKRKFTENEDVPIKKIKIESNKNEIDCFRTLLQMGLKKEGMSAMVCILDSQEWDTDSVVKKLTAAAIFQDALKGNGDFCYSSELMNFLRAVLVRCVEDSDHWLSIKSDACEITKDRLLNICTEERDINLLAVSILFHSLRLIKDVLACNIKILPNCRDLFNPLRILIGKLPVHLYPKWVREEIDSVMQEIGVVDTLPVAIMRMKKKFKIVELLEPELEDKFDPKKNVTKVLKKKIKNEKKALRKDIKLTSQARVRMEVAEGRKTAEIRDKKTLAIINNLNQTS